MCRYDTISTWHGPKLPRREIARRLRLDVKTVRRAIKKVEAGDGDGFPRYRHI